ncbi:M15 family metallopeptidase [Streptococcus macacae]|uniref:Serine-type D-Ala-D-Ala carboxypeptidase n=1 Tax=Streptococcus macacae NCTC 11558 TaxID=764298 RepID=G5JV68_9STRE|nr:D-alanyl-D-alanine carboxypeptidase family protein [Streptococcus macacae]EHJ53029.1 serine-type D-Ala-D-Ala carboxypeptidase [Streptococcus macacae NCTC 11558]SUN77693.1 D-alanyl-D-alanine carboxypeptidase [Streptococcus macacae NCTC 11558]
MRKKISPLSTLVLLTFILIFVLGLYFFLQKSRQTGTDKSIHQKVERSKTSSAAHPHRGISSKDWELVLVNRDNRKSEMNPELTDINGIKVDSRIAENTKKFLAAAQQIDASEHLISGYRSVNYQQELFNNYVEQEKAADPSLSQEDAEKKVQTYSQPAGASEHQTGLAIDMSTVDSLNESDPSVVAKVASIAPKYGFVLRFPKDKKSSTGIDYEDWHYRYVGVKSAEYMTKHHLTLEDYLRELKEK